MDLEQKRLSAVIARRGNECAQVLVGAIEVQLAYCNRKIVCGAHGTDRSSVLIFLRSCRSVAKIQFYHLFRVHPEFLSNWTDRFGFKNNRFHFRKSWHFAWHIPQGSEIFKSYSILKYKLKTPNFRVWRVHKIVIKILLKACFFSNLWQKSTGT